MEERKLLKRKYIDIILCLMAVTIMPFYLYGSRIYAVVLAAVATAIVVDYICIRISGKKSYEKFDYSCVVTALIVALLMPATVPLWIPCVATFIALAVAKHPFGGEGKNTFNPAAVGLAFSVICWPEYVLKYPLPTAAFTNYDMANIPIGASPASILIVGGTPKIDYFDIFLGKFCGPIGATCMLVLAACLFYLVIRKTVSLRVVLSALLVVGICAVIFPRVATGRFSSLMFEGCSGGLIFGLVFMSSDPATMPKTKSGQVLYGLIIGGLIMIFRNFGAVELEFPYAILIANIFAIPCDNYALFMERTFKKMFRKKKISCNVVVDNLSAARVNVNVDDTEKEGSNDNA